jgi:EamA domain-containing membrane protein RarD
MPPSLSTKGLLNLSVVMTYAYVNPLIAVILGRLVLGERITPIP